MNLSNIVLHETTYLRIKSILTKAQRDLSAELVMLIDRSGRQIACEGLAFDIDQTALATLAAANIAATDGLARLVGEPGFTAIHHQGKHRSIHVSEVAGYFSLVLVFNEAVTSGMVRWKVKRATASLDDLMAAFATDQASRTGESRVASGETESPSFTDEELDKLLGQLSPKSDTKREA